MKRNHSKIVMKPLWSKYVISKLSIYFNALLKNWSQNVSFFAVGLFGHILMIVKQYGLRWYKNNTKEFVMSLFGVKNDVINRQTTRNSAGQSQRRLTEWRRAILNSQSDSEPPGLILEFTAHIQTLLTESRFKYYFKDYTVILKPYFKTIVQTCTGFKVSTHILIWMR